MPFDMDDFIDDFAQHQQMQDASDVNMDATVDSLRRSSEKGANSVEIPLRGTEDEVIFV